MYVYIYIYIYIHVYIYIYMYICRDREVKPTLRVFDHTAPLSSVRRIGPRGRLVLEGVQLREVAPDPELWRRRRRRPDPGDQKEGPAGAAGRLSYVFLRVSCCLARSTITGIAECHQNFTRISLELHQNFARIPNWSTLKKGITTTQPSQRGCAFFWGVS